MKRLFNYIMLIGISGLAIYCAEPEEPVVDPQVIGNWVVVEFFAEKQVENSELIEKLIIDRNGNFILEDANGVLNDGTWSYSENILSLNKLNRDTILLQIITLNNSKAHMLYDFYSPILGDFEIRYLMSKDEKDHHTNSGS